MACYTWPGDELPLGWMLKRTLCALRHPVDFMPTGGIVVIPLSRLGVQSSGGS